MLKLPAILMHDTATSCLTEMLSAARAETTTSVAVDASALVRFDSTALAVLLELRRTVLQLGKTLSLQGVSPRLTDLARLYGIAELLPTQA